MPPCCNKESPSHHISTDPLFAMSEYRHFKEDVTVAAHRGMELVGSTPGCNRAPTTAGIITGVVQTGIEEFLYSCYMRCSRRLISCSCPSEAPSENILHTPSGDRDY